ncbi:MAG: hypothetical protein ACLQNE_12460 [Thermoguttaceae bacterium]
MFALWWIPAAAMVLLVFLGWMWLSCRIGFRRSRFTEARRLFHRQRERLEAKFVQLGTVTNRRDSPRWIDCEFDDDVAYAWNRSTGELNAFVAVTIELEENGDRPAEIADLVSNLRAATAVFRFQRKCWETEGRAIFNLSPAQAIQFYHRDLELLAQEASGKG